MIARPLYALLATLALGACAHTAATPAPATVTETSATRSSNPAAVPPGKPTAENLLGQLLALIEGSQTISDFTPERLNSAMGQVVQFVRDDERRYRAFGPLTKEWSYGFGVDETKLDGRWFEFRFDRNVAGASPPMTEICGLDFDRFTQQFELMGFARERNIVEDGRWMSDFFTRPGMRVEVFPRGEAAEPQALVAHKCVEWVYIRMEVLLPVEMPAKVRSVRR
ncbi:hypothetical protein ACDH70_01920 [Xanthomonas axonopodis pv. poinsettiicola]|uniref:hypothetical protein n=1 Tax=Xanthomonas TaxID=338 RepID=UPI001E2C7ECE|nr:hypothetical protein [Xanthomonas codiaei]MCC8535716.1 hypothetical protein [Xanthomonas codiaei]